MMNGKDKKKNTNQLTLVTNGQATGGGLRSPVCGENVPHLMASASSPSLLTGCGDPSTPTGSRIERHCHSHHIHAGSSVTSPDVQNTPAQVVEFPPSPSPLVSPVPASQPQDSSFLSPAPPRRTHLNSNSERPNSAPTHHLERISGMLLRLVGDHYLCLTCGRQLRTIGDQLALETDLRRAFSTSHLYSNLEDQRRDAN
ncbi:hypothetical protein EGW08_001772 [Elysia chlorotica]|uniref:Uncharacterized protein n=1 Tax=Elysia chlorotica TaxID=188477 RepID=A0A433U9H7_ELYCH|nr:hypothetical protein EGW08_001772 [Elysia chlorotica]